MTEPIKSQKEAQQVREYLINTLADTFKISREQSEKRVTALFESGILEGGNPEDPDTQRKIDEFVSIER